MAFLYGRAGRLAAKNGGFRPGQSDEAPRREPHGLCTHGTGPPERLSAISISYVNWFCMGLLYGRAGRLTVENGGFRPGQGMITCVSQSPRNGDETCASLSPPRCVCFCLRAVFARAAVPATEGGVLCLVPPADHEPDTALVLPQIPASGTGPPCPSC
jgi:hypothetical protein